MQQNLSEDIEQYILKLFEDESEEFVSLRRKEVAEIFNCVPSQINYVLRSRFSPERGYLIESRRGEFGYIKILRINSSDPKEKIKQVKKIVGKEITVRSACRLLSTLQERGFLNLRERLLIEVALAQAAQTASQEFYLNQERVNKITADTLKRLLITIIDLNTNME